MLSLTNKELISYMREKAEFAEYIDITEFLELPPPTAVERLMKFGLIFTEWKKTKQP